MNNHGFTLVEIIIVLGILFLMAGFGLFMSMDFYRSYAFRYEENLAVSLLQKARSRAMANVNQTAHGVHFGVSDYTLFEGSTYDAGASTNQNIPINSGIATSGLVNVVFNQLKGDSTTTGDIIISGQSQTASISINTEGAILY